MSKQAQWAERVSAWRASGKTLSEFAEGQAYKASTLQWWERKLRRSQQSSRSTMRPEATAVARSTGPVRMARVAPVPRAPYASILVEVSGARVVVQRGFDAELFYEVVAALRGAG